LKRRAFAFLICGVFSTAGARAEGGRRVVFFVEGTGNDSPALRLRLREAIPEHVVPADALDFRAAMYQHGQRAPVRQSLGSAKERNALFERMRTSARDIGAEGVVYVSVSETPRRRLLRVIVLWAKDDAPALDQVVTLDPAVAKSDGLKMKNVLGPVFERVAPPPPPPPAPPDPVPPKVEPVAPAPALAARPPADAPATPGKAPADRPTVTAGLSLDFFPAGFAPSYAQAKVAIALAKTVALVPELGGGYIPAPADDMAVILGGAIRLTPGATWTFEPSVQYGTFPKFVVWYQGALRAHAVFGPAEAPPTLKLGFRASVTRWLWSRGFGAPGAELTEVFATLDAQVRATRRLVVAPNVGAFVYDRSLVGSRAAVNVVTFALAPYPVLGFLGADIGFDTGRWMPYFGGRYFAYSADVGSGVLLGPGLRLTSGRDFVDARMGYTLSRASGPLALDALNGFPMVHVDAGVSF